MSGRASNDSRYVRLLGQGIADHLRRDQRARRRGRGGGVQKGGGGGGGGKKGPDGKHRHKESSLKCFTCRRPGHRARDCPFAAGLEARLAEMVKEKEAAEAAEKKASEMDVDAATGVAKEGAAGDAAAPTTGTDPAGGGSEQTESGRAPLAIRQTEVRTTSGSGSGCSSSDAGRNIVGSPSSGSGIFPSSKRRMDQKFGDGR